MRMEGEVLLLELGFFQRRRKAGGREVCVKRDASRDSFATKRHGKIVEYGANLRGDRARNATRRVDTLFQILLNHVSDRFGDRNGAFVILAALIPSVRFRRVKLDIFKNGNFGKSHAIP